MSYSDNPYYNPTDNGLRIVDELDQSSGYYEFNIFVVWQDTTTGEFYCGSDSGCSCYSPFEFTSRGALDHLANMAELTRALDDWHYNTDHCRWGDVLALKATVRRAGLR